MQKVNQVEFLKLLKNEYLRQPSSTLPNAFWKTGQGMKPQLECFVEQDSKGTKKLVMRDFENWIIYWDREGNFPVLSGPDKERLRFALAHQHYLSHFVESVDGASQQPFFRLSHSLRQVEAPILSDPLVFRVVDPKTELADVAEIINLSYSWANYTKDVVEKWIHHPVYDPALWVWVVDQETNALAGLGIAEFDARIPEVSLEWIQVHPNYRKRGVGQAIVLELLHRSKQKEALFATVSGKQGDDSNPEGLYRRCGFEGSDVWWVLRRGEDS